MRGHYTPDEYECLCGLVSIARLLADTDSLSDASVVKFEHADIHAEQVVFVPKYRCFKLIDFALSHYERLPNLRNHTVDHKQQWQRICRMFLPKLAPSVRREVLAAFALDTKRETVLELERIEAPFTMYSLGRGSVTTASQ